METASNVRGALFRMKPLNLAKTRSIGLRSGECFGQEQETRSNPSLGSPVARPLPCGSLRRQPDMTLLEIQERLIANCGERFSSSVIWRFFDRHGITFKKRSYCNSYCKERSSRWRWIWGRKWNRGNSNSG